MDGIEYRCTRITVYMMLDIGTGSPPDGCAQLTTFARGQTLDRRFNSIMFDPGG